MRPINLLPPKALERARARRRASLWMLLGVVVVVALGAGVFWYQGQVSDRKDELAREQEVLSQLQVEVRELAEFAALKDEFDTSVLILAVALESDVVWGRILNDLGRMIPDRVWIDSFTGTINAADPVIIGEVSVVGTGFDFPDVSAWLRSLNSSAFPSVDQTWVTNISASLVGEVPVVRFNSSTFLTEESLSDRLAQRVPDVS